MSEQMTYPPYFYKAFKEEGHAINFIEKGEMHFGSLTYYGQIEDPTRQDKTEGYSQVIVPGRRTNSDEEIIPCDHNKSLKTCICTENGIAAFAFCVSSHNVNLDHLREKGEFIVKINSPEKLLMWIDVFCEDSVVNWPNSDAYSVTLSEVYYSKGMIYGEETSDLHLLGLSTCQKHESYSKEKEYRYLLDSGVPKSNCTKEHVMVCLDKRLGFCELI